MNWQLRIALDASANQLGQLAQCRRSIRHVQLSGIGGAVAGMPRPTMQIAGWRGVADRSDLGKMGQYQPFFGRSRHVAGSEGRTGPFFMSSHIRLTLLQRRNRPTTIAASPRIFAGR
jgi:hypothetical protein